MKGLLELREQLEDFWEDFALLTDKEEVARLRNSVERMRGGRNISHGEFWDRLGIH